MTTNSISCSTRAGCPPAPRPVVLRNSSSRISCATWMGDCLRQQEEMRAVWVRRFSGGARSAEKEERSKRKEERDKKKQELQDIGLPRAFSLPACLSPLDWPPRRLNLALQCQDHLVDGNRDIFVALAGLLQHPGMRNGDLHREDLEAVVGDAQLVRFAGCEHRQPGVDLDNVAQRVELPALNNGPDTCLCLHQCRLITDRVVGGRDDRGVAWFRHVAPGAWRR